jgi:hypothetical protein
MRTPDILTPDEIDAEQEDGAKQACSEGSQQKEKHWPNGNKLDHEANCQFPARA